MNGQDITNSGTVILVNLSRFPIDWYKPMKRVLAVLQWESNGKQFCAVAQGPVNLGNGPIAWIWTIAVGVAVLFCIIALSQDLLEHVPIHGLSFEEAPRRLVSKL